MKKREECKNKKFKMRMKNNYSSFPSKKTRNQATAEEKYYFPFFTISFPSYKHSLNPFIY